MPIGSLEKTLVDLEKKLLDTESRQSKTFLESTLHDEFVEIGASGGVYNKQQTIISVGQQTGLQYKTSDFRVSPLSDNIVLLNYKLATFDNSVEVQQSIRSSIWKLENDNWQIVFHQGTIAEQGLPN